MISRKQQHGERPQPLVQVKTHQASGTIILNRPEKCNALSRELIRELVQAFDDLHQQKSVRAVILTGSGAEFCSGLDLHEMQATFGREDAWSVWRDDAIQYRQLIDIVLQFPKPVIAAVNGTALASGAGLVLACDIVVAATEASFGFPEPLRGLAAGLTAPLLAFRIGPGRAAPLLLTGHTIGAEEAHRIGVFHELVAYDQVWARAHEIATECAESAAEAVQLTKKMLNETIGEHLGVSLSAGAAASAASRTTEAAGEGVKAFLEKRKPNWP